MGHPVYLFVPNTFFRHYKITQDLPGDAEDSPLGALENVLKWLVPSSRS